jgi:hypothetical protein
MGWGFLFVHSNIIESQRKKLASETIYLHTQWNINFNYAL